MEIVTGELIGPPAGGPPEGVAVAIGNFDGVHRGHQAVIARAQAAAAARGLVSAALTFEPHPSAYFQPDAPPFRLTPAPLKARRLAQLGLDRLFVAGFDARLAALSAEAFCARVLHERLGARHVIVGEDFRFGAKRGGDVEALTRFGVALGFTVEAVAPVGGAAAYSSSAARRALQDGRPEAAADILGAWHRIEGVVERGDQRGRELGFPTANLSLDGVLQPAFGVYAVVVDILDGAHRGRALGGAASLGLRPQFDKKTPNFETFLFDFSGDLYGATISVGLVRRLRAEARFESVDALVAQMARDCDAARAALAADAARWP